jgi:hypothetical protein
MAVSIEEYSKVLFSLEEALAFPKTDKKVMGTLTSAPKQVLREMAQNGFIENVDLWFDFLDT